MTKFGKSEKTLTEMFSEAAMEAINESNLKPKDVEALFLGNAGGQVAEGQTILASFAADEIGLAGKPATLMEGACASGTITFRNACMWVASGSYDIVLAGGTERNSVVPTDVATLMMASSTETRYEHGTGISFPGVFAMMAHLYSKKYGVPLKTLKEAMALVAIKNHKNAMNNPKAQIRKEITMQMVLESIMVASPIQFYDCCPVSDGAAAVVIAAAEVAKKLHPKPVYVAGMGQSSAGALISQKDITIPQARVDSARQAYAMAGLTPKDIDVCEVHDCFTIAEIVATECLGFFDYGTGYKALERGDTQIGGKIPVNPSGGLKAKGHPVGATGAAQIYEITKQLRGECGPRQVEGAKIGMTDTLGGDLSTVANIILGR
jgi:acetyl-CoA C-acetyltransferase/acetyl-CoA acyltransferase